MIRNTSREVPAFLAKVRVAVARDIRGRRFGVFAIGIPLAIYLTYLVTGIGAVTGPATGGIGWPAYLMVSMAALGAMNAGLGVAAETERGTPGAVRSGDASADSGCEAHRNLGVNAIASMVLVLPPVILVLLTGALDGIGLPIEDWVRLVTMLWVGALPFVALGLLLGPLLDADTGDVVLLGIVVVLAILGGLFQPIDTFPDSLATFARVLPSHHLADLGWTTVADHVGAPGDFLVLVGYTLAIGGIVVWRNRSKDKPVRD
jgi:ABC-2 type transport system permease protein